MSEDILSQNNQQKPNFHRPYQSAILLTRCLPLHRDLCRMFVTV